MTKPRDIPEDQNVIRQRVSRLVDEVSQLLRTGMSSSEFCRTWLERFAASVGADCGVVWLPSDFFFGGPATSDGDLDPSEATPEAAAGAGFSQPVVSDPGAAAGSGRANENGTNLIRAGAVGETEGLSADVCRRLLRDVSGSKDNVPGSSLRGRPDVKSVAVDSGRSLCVVPLNSAGTSDGAVVLGFSSEQLSPSIQNAVAQIGEVFVELLGEFRRDQQLSELLLQRAEWQLRDDFRRELARAGDADLTWVLVNGGRRVLRCDRLTVLRKHRGRFRVERVSGVDVIDHGSRDIRGLEDLTDDFVRRTRVMTSNRSRTAAEWLTRESVFAEEADRRQDAAAGQDAAADYFQQSDCREVGLVLVGDDSAVLIAEQFPQSRKENASGTNSVTLRRRFRLLADDVSPLIAQWNRYDRLPLIHWNRRLERTGIFRRSEWPPLRVLTAMGIMAAVTVMALMPVDFEVEARGELQPVRRQFVYAPRDGIVTGFGERVTSAVGQGLSEEPSGDRPAETIDAETFTPGKVPPGEVSPGKINAGDTVIILQNADLDYALTQALGEYQTVSQRLE
ncbi:MAG: hypothetical protein KDA89_19495, partial [Planctomycetaceae bacterium]|nr:hypothetical protein [Planctomycetaceae bacterium]